MSWHDVALKMSGVKVLFHLGHHERGRSVGSSERQHAVAEHPSLGTTECFVLRCGLGVGVCGMFGVLSSDVLAKDRVGAGH